MNKLVITGTGAGISVVERGGSSCVVFSGQTCLLFDCGEGISGWVNKFQWNKAIQYVFISHLHPDHHSGLFTLLQNMKIAGRTDPLTVWCPEEAIEIFQQMQSAFYLAHSDISHMFPVYYQALKSNVLYNTPQIKVKAWPTDHFAEDVRKGYTKPRPCFGFTLDSDTTRLVISSDIGSPDCMINELNEHTTLLCESAHISHKDVYETAKARRVKQIIFTHIGPDELNLKQFCADKENVTIAHDGLKVIW